jgi:hypothetical protein
VGVCLQQAIPGAFQTSDLRKNDFIGRIGGEEFAVTLPETGIDSAAEVAERILANLVKTPVKHNTGEFFISASIGASAAWTKWDELRDSTKIKMAEQAIKAGVVQILPLVSAADKPGNQAITGWEDAVRVAAMNTRDLESIKNNWKQCRLRTGPRSYCRRGLRHYGTMAYNSNSSFKVATS